MMRKLVCGKGTNPALNQRYSNNHINKLLDCFSIEVYLSNAPHFVLIYWRNTQRGLLRLKLITHDPKVIDVQTFCSTVYLTNQSVGRVSAILSNHTKQFDSKRPCARENARNCHDGHDDAFG